MVGDDHIVTITSLKTLFTDGMIQGNKDCTNKEKIFHNHQTVTWHALKERKKITSIVTDTYAKPHT